MVPPPDPRKVRRLWAVVIGLGVLIVIALIMLVVGIIASGGKPKPQTTTTSLPASEGAPGFDLDVPAGARVTQMTVDGPRVAVVISSASGEEIVVIDSSKGTVLSRIRLKPAP